MQASFIRISVLIALLSFVFSSCKKEADITKSPTPPTALSFLYQFVIDALPGEPANGQSGFYAQVMLVNEKNETVLNNVKLPIQYNGKYKTAPMELPLGTYRVVKFIIRNDANVARFIAPVTGSIKAAQVSKPLYISYSLPQNKPSEIAVEVLKIENGDTPESFGYTPGSFDYVDNNTPPDQENGFFKLKLRAYAQVGEIYYDSIPATVTMTIVHKSGPVTRQQITLAAGTNVIDIPKAAHRYEFEFSKWGITDLVVLNHDQIREESVYGIGGRIAAKKLKQELTYRLVNGSYVPESKVEYSYYNGNGQLHRIDYYEKQLNGQSALVRYEVFSHNTENKITRIGQYSSSHVFQGETIFLYNTMGKPYHMTHDESGVITTAFVTYFQSPNRENAHIKYSYSHNSNNMDYNMAYEKGNLVETAAATANQSSEIGLYQYDLNINPFLHLGRPDIFLSNQSKNNVVAQQKQFTGSYPTAYPYQFNYTYNNEGYPKEVVTHYLSPVSNTPSYTLKTIYTYL